MTGRSLGAAALVVAGLLGAGPAAADPSIPIDQTGFALAVGWPASVEGTVVLGQRRAMPFVSLRWDPSVEQFAGTAGLGFYALDSEYFRIRLLADGAGLGSLGPQVAPGARVGGEVQAIAAWRWFRAGLGPRLDLATTLGKDTQSRFKAVGVAFAGFVYEGVGLWAVTEGGYTFSGGLRGGVTGRTRLVLSLPMAFPGS